MVTGRKSIGGGALPEKKKMGRPTDSPKRHEVKARVDDAFLKILDDYCIKHNKNRAEGVRDAIYLLKNVDPK